MRRFLSANPYLVIVRAFTKTYAMPGVRLGYLLAADKALLEKIRLQQPEWSVSMLAQCAGLAALSLDRVASVNERCGTDREAGDGANGEPDRKSADSTSYLTTALQVIHDERDYVCQRLRNLGAHVYDGEAGFVLFSCDRELRRCDGIRGIESAGSGKHFYRIGLREHSDNVCLLDRIQSFLSQ